jgi:mono/diheme cytochrome c family protein
MTRFVTRKRLLAFAGIAIVSCADPVLSDAVEQQGNETSGIEKGEFHRAGQPCGTCHQEGGPASDFPFTVAGTIFAQPMRQVGVEGAEVRMTDADGTKHTAKTNCVGNFFVKSDEWLPKYPILVEVAKNNVRRSMRSAIGRDASCAGCHVPAADPVDPLSQVPHIYLFSGDEPGSPEGAADCPVDPKRPGSP